MTDTISEHADQTLHKGEPWSRWRTSARPTARSGRCKGINLTVNAGEVTCVLGDNGAGKSTLIKIISGLHPHNEGTLKVDGKEVHFSSPREALDHGIATVYQDLAVVGADGGVAQLLPRLGDDRAADFPLSGLKVKEMKRDRRRGAAQDGHRGQGHRPAHRRRSPAVSASASPSPAPSTSAPAC